MNASTPECQSTCGLIAEPTTQYLLQWTVFTNGRCNPSNNIKETNSYALEKGDSFMTQLLLYEYKAFGDTAVTIKRLNNFFI